jgi:uncharacterized protein YkwD
MVRPKSSKSACLLSVLSWIGAGCGPRAAADSPASSPHVESVRGAEHAPIGERYSWQSETRSPRTSATPSEAWLIRECGAPDQGLEHVAQRLAARQARGLPQLEMPEVDFALRSEGLPYVWARAWTVEGRALAQEEVALRMRRWLGSFAEGGQRRCGVARVPSRSGEVLAAVALDVLADLDPLPSRARMGEWLSVQARLHTDVSAAEVVVLGPRGRPRSVPSSFDGGQVRARFAVDQPGQWLVQLMATTENGPRPVGEALIYVESSPPDSYFGDVAPGEAVPARSDPAAQLIDMVNEARRSEGLPPVRRNVELERIASAHAGDMRSARRVGHDVGKGDPRQRLERAELGVRSAGENVAHAADLVRAHRALWASPSHRGNVLHVPFSAIGVGVVEDPDGSLWVCELFADFD